MRHDPTDDELLRSYLLDELPPEEAEPLEQRLLAEDDLFELCEAVEADLLAACDRGELAAADRERVLRRLASFPDGRQRLALARGLNLLANPAAQVLPFKGRAEEPRRPAMYRWAALAASVLVAAGLVSIGVERHRKGGGASAPWMPVESAAPAHPVLPQAGVLAPAPAPADKPLPRPAEAVFQLALTSLRGSGAPEKLRVPAGAAVQLQISVEEMVGLSSFQLAIRNRQAETVWKDTLTPAVLHGVHVLLIHLPADTLASGTYEIEARGLAPGREPEELSPLDVVVEKDEKR